MTTFQKTALAALLATLLLIFVGAIVRATGSGLGCPDWPTCWGSMWPPSSLEEVDFDRLDMEKFQRKRPGITQEELAAEFNPTHTWTEYINRLTSMPVGIFTLATLVGGIVLLRRGRVGVFLGTLAAFVLVGVNAWLGKSVVETGLKPGIITLHMALAILLLCVLVWVIHRGGDQIATITGPRGAGALFAITLLLLAVIAGEGVMGSQVREVTDQLAREYKDTPRSEWHEVLEARPIYLVHRSFSWVVLGLAAVFLFASRGLRGVLAQPCRLAVGAIVAAQMMLGILMSHVSVSPVVQVLHIGLSSLLVVALFWLLLGLWARRPETGATRMA